MWQITRDRQVSPIRHFAAGGAEMSDQTGVPVRLSIVFVSWIERAGPKWNTQNLVGRRFRSYAELSLSEKISAIDRKSEDHRSHAAEKVSSLQWVIHANHQCYDRWLERRDNPGACQVRRFGPRSSH